LDPFFWLFGAGFSFSSFSAIFGSVFSLGICVEISPLLFPSLLIAADWLGSFSAGVLLLIMIVGCFSGKDCGFSLLSTISS